MCVAMSDWTSLRKTNFQEMAYFQFLTVVICLPIKNRSFSPNDLPLHRSTLLICYLFTNSIDAFEEGPKID